MKERTERNAWWRSWMVDLLGLGCCVLLTIVGYVIAIAPVLQSEQRLSQLRSEIEGVENRADQLLQLSRMLDQSLSNVRGRLDANALELQPSTLVNTRVNVLTGLAADSGLTLDEVLPGAAETGSLFMRVPIRISGSGGYSDCARFLHRLRTDLRDTTVQSLSLVGDPSGERPGRFVFELVWYAAPADSEG